MDKYVGIDIGGTKMLMLAEYNGEKIVKKVHTGYDYTSFDIKNEISDFIKSLPFEPLGIGIAIPGLVKNFDTVVISKVIPKIKGMTTEFLKIGNIPMYFINDVKAAIIEESSCIGDDTTGVVIMAGTGIGMGIISNGKFINGCNGWAGELGSIPVQTPDGIKMLDDVASGACIIRNAKMDAASLTAGIKAGDKRLSDIIKSAAEYFGMGIASVINILNPEFIILGGGTINYEGYYETALKSAEQYALEDLWKSCNVCRAKEPKYVVALGAMRLLQIKSNIG